MWLSGMRGLAKVLCHKVVVVIHETHELGSSSSSR